LVITPGATGWTRTWADAKTLIDNARAVDPTVKILIANVVTRAPLCGFDHLNPTIAMYNGAAMVISSQQVQLRAPAS